MWCSRTVPIGIPGSAPGISEAVGIGHAEVRDRPEGASDSAVEVESVSRRLDLGEVGFRPCDQHVDGLAQCLAERRDPILRCQRSGADDHPLCDAVPLFEPDVLVEVEATAVVD